MLKRFPRTRAGWIARARAAKMKSPARFRFYILASAGVLMVAHYTIDELGYHPEVSLWKVRAFWSFAWLYAAGPFVNWFGWKLLSASRVEALKSVLVMSVVLCAGSVLAYCVPDMLRSIERLHLVKFDPTVEKWHWSTFRFYWQYWTLAVLVVGNLMLFWRWRRGTVTQSTAQLSTSEPLPANRKRSILKGVTITTATAACGVTALYLGLPRLPADGDIVSLTRTLLLQTHLRNDFDYIIHYSFSPGNPLAPLLTHVKLADLQRRQFYLNLDETLFQQYVLSPEIDPLPLNELNWRRPLWEEFYPRVRGESEPSEAARIVVRLLRERVGIDPAYDYRVGVETIWTQQMTDETGFERIYVAALRSVGIASRLNDSGQVELLQGNTWQPAPRPVVASLQPAKFPVPESGLINFRN